MEQGLVTQAHRQPPQWRVLRNRLHPLVVQPRPPGRLPSRVGTQARGRPPTPPPPVPMRKAQAAEAQAAAATTKEWRRGWSSWLCSSFSPWLSAPPLGPACGTRRSWLPRRPVAAPAVASRITAGRRTRRSCTPPTGRGTTTPRTTPKVRLHGCTARARAHTFTHVYTRLHAHARTHTCRARGSLNHRPRRRTCCTQAPWAALLVGCLVDVSRC